MAMVNGLYTVPQTDDANETAMAELIARFRLRAPKPEALASIPDATIALHLAAWVARVSSSLGDRATLPILRWDASLDAACIKLASWDTYDERGRNRQAGADASIDKSGERQEAFLARLRSQNREEQPRYEDSGGNFAHDAPMVRSQPSAGAWTRTRKAGCGCP